MILTVLATVYLSVRRIEVADSLLQVFVELAFEELTGLRISHATSPLSHHFQAVTHVVRAIGVDYFGHTLCAIEVELTLISFALVVNEDSDSVLFHVLHLTDVL